MWCARISAFNKKKKRFVARKKTLLLSFNLTLIMCEAFRYWKKYTYVTRCESLCAMCRTESHFELINWKTGYSKNFLFKFEIHNLVWLARYFV